MVAAVRVAALVAVLVAVSACGSQKAPSQVVRLCAASARNLVPAEEGFAPFEFSQVDAGWTGTTVVEAGTRKREMTCEAVQSEGEWVVSISGAV